MTDVQLKTQIDTDITNKTSSKSISPLNVGKNVKDVVDYTNQKIVTITSTVENKVDKVTGKSLIADTEIARLAEINGNPLKTTGLVLAVIDSKTTLQYDINTVNKDGGSEVKLPTTTEVGKEVLFLASNYAGTVSVYVNDAEDVKLSGGTNGISGNQRNLQINANEAYRFIYLTNDYWYYEKIINIPTNYYQLVSERSTDGTLVSNSNFKYPTEKAVKTYVDQEVLSNKLPFKLCSYNIGFLSDGSVNDTIVFSNLSANLVVNPVSLGVYEIFSDSSTFTSNKTFIPPFGYQGTTDNSGVIRIPIFNANALSGYYWAQRITSNTIRLSFTDVSGVFVNPYSILIDREIQLEIKVYN